MAQAKQPSGSEGKSELEVRRPGRMGQGRMSLMRPFEDIDRMFEGFFPRGWMRPLRPELESMMAARQFPAVDVIDHESEVIVRAEVPGVRKEDLDVSMSDSTLTIRGRTGHEEEEKREDYYCHEMTYGEFSRTVSLPTDVDAEKAKAVVKEGVLELTLPKKEVSKRKSIEIQAS